MATIKQAVKINLDNWCFENDIPQYRDKTCKAIEDFLPHCEGKVVLDLGCGDGAAYKSIRQAGLYYLGVDINQKKLNQIKGNTIKDEIYSYLKDCEDDSVDNIFCHHVLEHCANPHEIVQEIKRVVKYTAFIEVPCEPANSSHVVHIKDISEITPQAVDIIVSEQNNINPPEFRVIFRKQHASS